MGPAFKRVGEAIHAGEPGEELQLPQLLLQGRRLGEIARFVLGRAQHGRRQVPVDVVESEGHVRGHVLGRTRETAGFFSRQDWSGRWVEAQRLVG